MFCYLVNIASLFVETDLVGLVVFAVLVVSVTFYFVVFFFPYLSFVFVF
jgi:hypothetical protein